jgi:hypothetical protein
MAQVTFTHFARDVLGCTFTPAQRVFALVAFDGVEPCQLDPADRELARLLFGAIDTIPPDARRVIVAVFGRGSGKDELGACFLLYRMLTADVSRCGIGDVPSAIVVAPDVKLATITKNRALEHARHTDAIARCLEVEGADGFALRRPQDGRLVAFEVLAATRAGSAARGRSVLSALLSECAFFRDESAAVNDVAIYSAVMPRLMRGGAVMLFSTPWAEAGLFHELYETNHGKSQTALVAQGSTSLMRDHDADIEAIVASETARDEVNAQREYGAEFIGIGSANFFDPASIDAAIDPTLEHPLPLPKHYVGRGVGVDLGFKLDASAQVIVLNEKVDGKDRVTVAYVDEVRPTPGFPLSPTAIVKRFAVGCQRYGVANFMADGVYEQSVRELAAQYKIRMYLAPAGNAGKLETYLAAKELFTEGKVRSPKPPRLIAQLKAVISRPRPGGIVKIEVPRRIGQSHGDVASAAVLALYQARQANAGESQRQALQQQAARIQYAGAVLAGTTPDNLRHLDPSRRTEVLFALASGHITEDDMNTSVWTRIALARRAADGTSHTEVAPAWKPPPGPRDPPKELTAAELDAALMAEVDALEKKAG